MVVSFGQALPTRARPITIRDGLVEYLRPGNHQSAGQRKTGKTRKGNAVIRSILCECAHAARRTKSVFAHKYRSLVIRRGHKKAIAALAHKLIRTIFFMLTRRQPDRDSGFDYAAANVAKNAPRWIKALKKYGRWPQVAATTRSRRRFEIQPIQMGGYFYVISRFGLSR